jgi:hypothetical protein
MNLDLTEEGTAALLMEAWPDHRRRSLLLHVATREPAGGQRKGLRSLRTCSNWSGNNADVSFQWSSIARIALL